MYYSIDNTVYDVMVLFEMNFPSYSFGLFLMSQDVQIKLRDAFRKMGDEFMTYTYATQAKVSIFLFFFFFYSHIIYCIGCYTGCTSCIQYHYGVTLDVHVFSVGIPPFGYPGLVYYMPRADQKHPQQFSETAGPSRENG